MTIFSPCPGATSDHAWRSIAVDIIDSDATSPLHIQGATWNMQMWCTSQADAESLARKKGWNPAAAHGNNPMDISEKRKEYIARKTSQIIELEHIIHSGNDFIFLQEPDWINHPELLSQYQEMLDHNGWGMVVTPGEGHQKLVTLFNRNKLAIDPNIPSKGLFRSELSGKFRGFQVNFTHIETQKPLVLVNLHLEFGKDYRHDMLTLQKQFVNDDLPCIMGGDTNNVQNMQLSTMIGDWHAATNISADGSGGLTTIHAPSTAPGKKPTQKTYDGFFVNPGRETYAQIEEKGGMRFDDLEGGQVQYTTYKPKVAHAKHRSIPGEPWQRTKDLKLRLEREAQEHPEQKLEIDTKLRALAQLTPPKKQTTNPIHLQSVDNYYGYTQKNRFHFYAAHYHHKVGDQAKTAILNQLLNQINTCQTSKQLEQLQHDVVDTPEYSILKTGQGLATRIFGLKTDSVKALEKMFEEAEDQLKSSPS